MRLYDEAGRARWLKHVGMHNAMIAGDGKNGAPLTPRPEWYDRALSILHDLEVAGREPGAVRVGNIQVHLSFPGDPRTVFLGCYPLQQAASPITRGTNV
jgi:hypothetical protein